MLDLSSYILNHAIFWSGVAVMVFVYLLAFQVRLIVPFTLRLVLAAKWVDGKSHEFDGAIRNAVSGICSNEQEKFLVKEYSATLRWIIVARTVSKYSILGLILWFLIAIFVGLNG